jgi:hypothetical protein
MRRLEKAGGRHGRGIAMERGGDKDVGGGSRVFESWERAGLPDGTLVLLCFLDGVRGSQRRRGDVISTGSSPALMDDR